jgi:hypothetical protein
VGSHLSKSIFGIGQTKITGCPQRFCGQTLNDWQTWKRRGLPRLYFATSIKA